jgi:hypothetical protein
MSISARRLTFALLLLARLAIAAAAEPDAQVKMPSFDALAGKASDSVSIMLDSTLLGIAAGFLDSNKPEDAAAKDLISGLKGVYVRSFTFDKEFTYPSAEVDMIRKQLAAPPWQRLVGVRSKKEQANVDIYMSIDQGNANGLVIIASEPRQFTVVNIVGSVDLQKLHRLEGKFGIPKLHLEEPRGARG